jgi:quercetin dioxygenase-like cupin family protein
MLLGAQMGSKAETPKAKIMGSTLLAAADLKWVPMPGLEGAMQAPLWGDPTKEAHGIFYKWPAGTKVGMHTHTHGDRGVVISGNMSFVVEGAAAKKLSPGSYFSFGGGVKHSTACEGDAPCVFFIEREGPFDAALVEETPK